MKVTLLNPEEMKDIFKTWGTFACECYATPQKYAEKVGKSCLESEHFSGSRTEYIKFKVEGVDRGIAEQAMRHEIGVRQTLLDEHTYDENPNNIIKNMKSFRYVDMNDFDYSIPENIRNNENALAEYEDIMSAINESRGKIKAYLIEDGLDKREVVEDANYVLPRATNTSLCIAFTLEAFIHYQHKRLCTRTQGFNRLMARLMKDEVLEYIPELKDKLVAQCQYLLWCPEGSMCCGIKPTKEQLIEDLKLLKELKKQAMENDIKAVEERQTITFLKDFGFSHVGITIQINKPYIVIEEFINDDDKDTFLLADDKGVEFGVEKASLDENIILGFIK